MIPWFTSPTITLYVLVWIVGPVTDLATIDRLLGPFIWLQRQFFSLPAITHHELIDNLCVLPSILVSFLEPPPVHGPTHVMILWGDGRTEWSTIIETYYHLGSYEEHHSMQIILCFIWAIHSMHAASMMSESLDNMSSSFPMYEWNLYWSFRIHMTRCDMHTSLLEHRDIGDTIGPWPKRLSVWHHPLLGYNTY